MTISLKPINIYQEFEPYDKDVDNRPLLDIQDNISEIVDLLGNLGFYSEILADPSKEPANGFTTFSCACIYSNSLLIPIDISKSIFEIDYSSFPIVLILGPKDSVTNAYPCLSFSAGIVLSNKFAYFTPNSQGRLLRVGPGGELVDQLYYDLAHASKGYQALYVGKILGPTSIVFGGNQVSILGNNFYLAKNRDDSTSGLITVQRDNIESNTVFKSININSVGSPYTYAEYINSYSSPNTYLQSAVPVYFSSSQLPFDQSTGLFTNSSLESSLNEVHFNTPSVNTFTGFTQTYLTSGVNVRSLLDFASVNVIHAPSYSNSIFELGQNISTKLIFTDRVKVLQSDPDIPIGIEIPTPIKAVGDSISLTTNFPAGLLPSIDTTGITVLDYFNTAGAYIGGIQDSSSLTTTRLSSSVEAANQAVVGFTSAGIKNAQSNSFTTNLVTDYSNSFTLIISTKSNTSVPSNIVINTDGYLNLSSVRGTLVNKMPVLDTEVAPKIYIDNVVTALSILTNKKIPLVGTATDEPITGSLVFDVSGNSSSTSKVLSFTSTNTADILSAATIQFLESDGSSFQVVKARSTPYISPIGSLIGSNELVTKDFLHQVSADIISGASFVTIDNPAQIITGDKTITGLFTFENNSNPNLTLVNQTGATPIDFIVGSDNILTITNPNEILLTRGTNAADADLSLVTKDYVDTSISGVGPGYDPISKHDLFTSPALTNVSKYGYSILGDLVQFWCETSTAPYPDSGGRTSGDVWNPEWSISLPENLFDKIFTINTQINNKNSDNRNNQDVWVQLVQFNPDNVSSFLIKYQGSSGIATASGYTALVYIVGLKGSLVGL